MILRSIQVRNFRVFRDVRVRFPEGVVGLLGPNGAGKSTLFEAVAWALYGNSMSRTAGHGIAGGSGPSEVELTYEADGEEYRFVRSLRGVWSRVSMWRRGIELDAVPLPLDGPTFLRTHYCRQGELNALARDAPVYRHSIVARLLGLDRLERLLARIKQDRAAIPDAPPLRDSETRAAHAAAELARARARLAEFGKRNRLHAEIALLEQDRARPDPRAVALEREVLKLSARIAALAGSRGPCPTCGAPVARDTLLATLNREQAKLRTELTEARVQAAARIDREIEQRRRRIGPVCDSRRDLLRALERAAAEEAQARATLETSRRADPERSRALGRLEALIEEFREGILGTALRRVQARASQVLATATAGRYTRIAIDRDFRIRMDGHILQRYSGGEQDVAALALRVGLAGLRTGDDFLLLDEPFGSQDPGHRRTLLEALRRLPFRQTFVVTHLEEVQDALPVSLRVRPDGHGSSRVEEAS